MCKVYFIIFSFIVSINLFAQSTPMVSNVSLILQDQKNSICNLKKSSPPKSSQDIITSLNLADLVNRSNSSFDKDDPYHRLILIEAVNSISCPNVTSSSAGEAKPKQAGTITTTCNTNNIKSFITSSERSYSSEDKKMDFFFEIVKNCDFDKDISPMFQFESINNMMYVYECFLSDENNFDCLEKFTICEIRDEKKHQLIYLNQVAVLSFVKNKQVYLNKTYYPSDDAKKTKLLDAYNNLEKEFSKFSFCKN